MAKVIAPNQQYNGLSAGVMFVNGVGETDNPHLLEWFESKGYTVEHAEPEQEEEQTPKPEQSPEPEPPADDMPEEPDTPEAELKPEKPAKKGK